MRRNVRSVALVMLLGRVLFCSADEITRTFLLDPAAIGISGESNVDAQKAVHDFLEKAGINIGSTAVPKLFYNKRTGVLHISADTEKVAAVEKALRESTPPRVLIHVALAEFSEAEQPEIEKLLGAWIPNGITWPETLNELLQSSPKPIFSRVFTEEEAKKAIRALEQKGNVLRAGPVQTISGRAVRAEFEDHEPVTIPPFHAPGKRAKTILDSLTE